MDWYLWGLIGWWTVSALLTVAWVGKQRKPLEPGAAAVTILIYLALAVGLLVTR